jgi:hypothetical protein
MRILEPDNEATEFHEVQITINVQEHYTEIVEVYRANINSPELVKVTSIKVVEPHTEQKSNLDVDLRRTKL